MKQFVGFFVVSIMAFAHAHYELSMFDLTIVGQISHADGLGRLPIGLTAALKDSITINHIKTPGMHVFKDVPVEVKKILTHYNKTPGNVALLFDILWAHKVIPSRSVPKKSLIKIAYSMIEGTRIPTQWVKILNETFDLVVVPDSFYEPVYKKSGVTIPIFVLPHGIEIESLLKRSRPERNPKRFIFGTSAAYWPRKNFEKLLEAFGREFSNESGVELHLHGRTSSERYMNMLKKIRLRYRDAKISMRKKKLSKKEYEDFLSSLDCYVLLSKGEGFSVTPREALALGIPCIITNNTAHQTLCRTGYVYPVESTSAQPAFYAHLGTWGEQFNCSIEDVQKALREMYENYDYYREKALLGRQWVESYTWSQLQKKWLSLIKPHTILLGQENLPLDDTLITNSPAFYAKYEKLIAGSV